MVNRMVQHNAGRIKLRPVGTMFRLAVLVLLLVVPTIQAQWNPRQDIGKMEVLLASQDFASGTLPESLNKGLGPVLPTRVLYDFESGADNERILSAYSQNLEIRLSSDFGVTQGKQCAHIRTTRPGHYAEFKFSKQTTRSWAGYDYLAVDLHVESAPPLGIMLEIRDAKSRDYFSRCTLTQNTKTGTQTLLWPISKLRRNGKEGLGSDQLMAGDLIQHDQIRSAKLFFQSPDGKSIAFWIDNVRLLHRTACHPPMPLSLPGATALAVDFGPAAWRQPGFAAAEKSVSASTEIASLGSGWPDPLSGTYVYAADGGILKFSKTVPNGEYHVILLGGLLIQSNPRPHRYLLRVNGNTLYDDTPSRSQIDSETYLHRFLWTAYSERKHGLFHDYIETMYPVFNDTVRVEDRKFWISAKNIFLSGVILIPVGHHKDAARLEARLRTTRAETFDRQTQWPFARSQVPTNDTQPVLDVFIPDDDRTPHPMRRATGQEHSRSAIHLTAAPDQNVFAKLCLRPSSDMGLARVIRMDRHAREAGFRTDTAQHYFVNYRYASGGITESGLLPTDSVYLEKDITQTHVVWWHIAKDAKPGQYSLELAVTVDGIVLRQVPVNITIHDITLTQNIPGAFGFYYKGRMHPTPLQEERYTTFFDTFSVMHDLGFTSVTLPDVARVSMVDVKTGNIRMDFDDTGYRAALAAGLGATKEQPLLLEQLSTARAIARRLPALADGQLDRNPGAEMKQKAFRPLWIQAMTEYRDTVNTWGGHSIVEVVDEPREHPNPWNRNLADTLSYGKWMGDLGINRFGTIMGDRNGGHDYTSLVDVLDAVSVHGNESSQQLQAKTLKKEKALWFFNDGLSRFRWGIYPWAKGATGRFEWHWCWPGRLEHNTGGYPGTDWHNPFTRMHGLVPNAPPSRFEAGMLLSSSIFTAADGLTDYNFAYTLEKTIDEHAEHPECKKNVNAARSLLARIRRDAGTHKPDLERWRNDIAIAIEGIRKHE